MPNLFNVSSITNISRNLPVKVPVVAIMVPQPITVGAHPFTVPDDVTAGKPKGAR